MDLRPGKGLHSILTQGVLDLLESSLEMISNVYTDERHDAEPGEILAELLATTTDGDEVAWQEEKDNFGHKVFRMLPYKKGAIRVTVVLTKQNELRLDIREWYDPAA